MQEDRAEPVKRSAPPREDEQVTKKSAETAPVPAPAAAAQGIPAEATYVLEQITPGVYGLTETGNDGSPPIVRAKERLVNLPEVFQSEHEAPDIGSDDDLQVEKCNPNWRACYTGDQEVLVNTMQLTRKEQKALDREISWREITAKGGEYLQAFKEAAEKEFKCWAEWGPVIPLTETE